MAEATAEEVSIQDILENISGVTTKLNANNSMCGGKTDKTYKSDVLKTALDTLQKAVCDLARLVEKKDDNTNDKKEIHEVLRQHGDEIDIHKQKNLKGKIVITSIKRGELPSCIGTKDTIKPVDLVQHVIVLTKQKYVMNITKDDIETCFFLPKGGILVSFWNKSPGSAFQRLVSQIKTKLNADMNLYFNFMLTNKRGNLLFEVRKQKKAGNIEKFFSDEDGNISFRLQPNSKPIKVTNIRIANTQHMKTMTVEEMLKEIPTATS